MPEDKNTLVLLPNGKPAPIEMIEIEKNSKPKWTFMEKPGMGFANIGGELIPLDLEARRTLRRTTFEELLDMPKMCETQTDYEEVENHFLGDK